MATKPKTTSTSKTLSSRVGGLKLLNEFEEKEKIPTGIRSLDAILHGGIPKNSIAEAYGPEQGGKSCIGLQLVGQAQKFGDCVYFDLENAFDKDKAANSGVNSDTLYFGDVSSGEAMFKSIEEIMGAGGVSLIVIDSVAAIMTEAELAGEAGDSFVASLARLMSYGVKRVSDFQRTHNPDTILFFVNQVRENIGGGGGFSFGPSTYTPGGRALKFYSSTRLKVGKRESIKAGEDIIGQKVIVENVKSRFAPPFQKATFDLYYDRNIGVSNESTIFDQAIKAKLIVQSGAWFSDADGVSLGQGKMRVLDKMRNDPDYTNSLVAQLDAV